MSKRAQELKRHLKEKHEPRRQCPFCKFEWTRPDKIKNHITTYHQDMFTAEVMAEFRALYGKKMITFLDELDHGPRRARADVEAQLQHSIRVLRLHPPATPLRARCMNSVSIFSSEIVHTRCVS